MMMKELSKEWPDSSGVAKTTYYPDLEFLDVEYKKPTSTYRYCEVPAWVWEELKQASSVGKFLTGKVKGVFHYIKL